MPSARSAPPPLSRWAEGRRIAVAVVAGLVVWSVQFTPETPQGGPVPLLDLLVGIGAIVGMHWRRRRPATVAVLTALATAVSGLALVASLIAFVSLVTTRRWKPAVLAGAVGCGAAYVYERIAGSTTDEYPWWALLVLSVVCYVIAALLGLYVGARRELAASARARAETAEREQTARVEQARLSERTRIAREMHDVLAHRISLLSLHAGALAFRTDLSPDEQRAAARVVQENAHQAMLDLRDVLGVLRDPEVAGPEASAARPDRPQPTLADLPALVQETRDAGTEVHVTGDALEGPTPADTAGRTAYRIVQEALTNARKHAPGAPVTLRLTGHPGDRLEVEVTNAVLLPAGRSSGLQAVGGAGSVTGSVVGPAVGSGLGLVGLAERVDLAGGGLEHGPTADGQYRIHAWLPWSP